MQLTLIHVDMKVSKCHRNVLVSADSGRYSYEFLNPIRLLS